MVLKYSLFIFYFFYTVYRLNLSSNDTYRMAFIPTFSKHTKYFVENKSLESICQSFILSLDNRENIICRCYQRMPFMNSLRNLYKKSFLLTDNCMNYFFYYISDKQEHVFSIFDNVFKKQLFH